MLIASIPAVGALIVVFVGEGFQRGRFRQQREAEDTRWAEQLAGERQRSAEERELERERWAEARNAELARQLLSERLRVYGALLGALEELAAAGREVAVGVANRPEGERSLDDLQLLLHALGSNDPQSARVKSTLRSMRTEVERWSTAGDRVYEAGIQAALLADDSYRKDLIDVLMFTTSMPPPHESPAEWIIQTGVAKLGPALLELRNKRMAVELIARRELGLVGAQRRRTKTT